ncbi:MAG TPA: outer membrane beta-barrel protein [Rhizomicrobium sp.]|nr:outer membrane beta-barrel protein [Rhizomicrobium sp.]
MNRILLTAAAALFLLPEAAQAAPYVGLDLNANLLNLDPADSSAYPQSAIGPQFHAGYRFDNLNLAAELGYGTNRGHQDPDNLRFNMLSADGLYYLPIGGFLNLILTAGVTDVNYGDSTATFKVIQKDDATRTVRQGNTIFRGDEFDWRAGTGLSFALTDSYEVRFITRYQPISMHGLADYSLALDFGMNFYF